MSQYATLREEKKLSQKGYEYIAGIDEVGRGPLAGPVVACACVIHPHAYRYFSFLKDSKQLTAQQRERWYDILSKYPEVEWGIGKVSEKMIDRINILQATRLAMKKAVSQLEKKLSDAVDFMLIDGNLSIDSKIPQRSVIYGDETIFSCAAASIVAKVTRDRLMTRFHTTYPRYGFDRHKGYGTPYHFQALRKYGPCPIHRLSFTPCKEMQRMIE